MRMNKFVFLLSILLTAETLIAREPIPLPAVPTRAVRARDLGIPFDGTPGPLNAITDVAGSRSRLQPH